jgi:hypothetical protein
VDFSEEKRERLISSLSEAGGRLRVRGALNPVLWLCGVVAVPCIICLSWSSNPPLAITIILYGVVGVALVGFLYLLFVDPDRLQSEDFILRKRTLDLIEEKGSKKAIDAATVQAISQTEFLALPEAQEDSK